MGVLGRGDGDGVTGGGKLTGSEVKHLGVWRWCERKLTPFLSSPWPCGEVDLGGLGFYSKHGCWGRTGGSPGMTWLAAQLCIRPVEVSGVPVESCQPCTGVCCGTRAAEDGVSALLFILRLLGGRAATGKRLPLVAPERPSHVGE